MRQSYLKYLKLLFWQERRNLINEDKESLRGWLKNNLYLPPPDVVKFNIIKKYAKKERIKVLCAASKICEKREILLESIFREIFFINVRSDGIVDFTCFDKIILSKLRSPSLFYFDSDFFLRFESKTQVLNHFICLIDLIFKDKENHLVLLDNAYLFDGVKLPTLHELKQILLQKRPYYGNIKSESNIFIFAPKL